jgi:nucleoside-diphosphate-sugar epimerase
VVEGHPLKIFGDGRQFRDFNYVDDVVLALLIAAADESANGQVYNLGAREAYSLLELAELLVDIYGSGSFEVIPFPEDRRRIDIGSYQGDFAKISQELGWQPQTSLRDGLAKSLAFYSRHLKHYV